MNEKKKKKPAVQVCCCNLHVVWSALHLLLLYSWLYNQLYLLNDGLFFFSALLFSIFVRLKSYSVIYSRVMCVGLQMDDPCLSAGGEAVSAVTVELSRESLDTILDGLGRIRDQLSVVAGKWGLLPPPPPPETADWLVHMMTSQLC